MKLKRMLLLLRKCYPNIKPFMRQNIAFILLTECVVVLTLLVPLIIRFLIDDVLEANQWDKFSAFVIFMGLAIIMSRMLSIATNILYNRFSANIEAKARDSLFSCIIKKDLEFFNSTGDGQIVDRLMRSPEQLHTIPSIYLERLISSIGTIIIVFVILFTINPIMALFSLVAVPIFIVIYVKTRERFFTQVQKAREESAKLTDFYVSTIRSIKQVKNICSEDYEQDAGEYRNKTIKRLSLKYAITGAFVTNGVQIVTQFNQLGVLIYGAQLIHYGQMTIGTLVAYYSYLDLLYQPFISIIQTLNDMNESLVGIERYLEYYNNDNEEFVGENGVASIYSPSITFSNVSFSYGSQNVLKNVNIQINAHEKVLVVGKSGIGKSTIVSLIKRFFPCSDGSIEIGGINLNQYNLKALRKNIAYTTQEDLFFPASIRENFIRIDPNISDNKIENILKKVELYDDIFIFGKNGLDTSLEKNAVAFSGGQRRRLSLAMMLACSAPIVILDEPFVGIDKKTQEKIWANIKEELRNKTVIIIEHNFSDPNYFQKVFEITGDGKVERTK